MSKHNMLKYKLIIGSVLLGVRMNSLLETVSKIGNSLFIRNSLGTKTIYFIWNCLWIGNSLLYETVSITNTNYFYMKQFPKLKQFILRKESNDAGFILKWFSLQWIICFRQTLSKYETDCHITVMYKWQWIKR